MEVNSLRSWKLKWTLHLLLAVVLSCTQCLTPYLTSPLTPCAKRITPSKQSLRKLSNIINDNKRSVLSGMLRFFS
jgi:hypothetical protein